MQSYMHLFMTLRNDPKLLYVICALVMVMKVGMIDQVV